MEDALDLLFDRLLLMMMNQISKLMKIHPVGDVLLRADGQTDGRTLRHDEANSRFSQILRKAPKKNFRPGET